MSGTPNPVRAGAYVLWIEMHEQIAQNKRRAVLYAVVFFIVWVGIGALVGLVAVAFTSSRTPGTQTNYAGAVLFGMIVTGILAVIGILYSVTSGARLVLAVSGARPADPIEHRQLINLVEELAIGDGMPKPAVYVIDDPSPNAFATGMSPDKAAITATSGLLQIMNREELEGVLGHEMSHIKNYDVRLLLIISTLIGMAGLIASIIWRSAFFMRPRGRDGQQITIIIFAAGALFGLVALLFGPLIRLALSRRREELADVSGVALTRNPEGLIHALQKLAQNDKPFKKFNHATAAMCIDDPLQHHEAWFHRLYDTHPPIAERIAVLERIAHTHSA
jgi:heat shock protein HtpX